MSRNRYRAYCGKCGYLVFEKQGNTSLVDGDWVTVHDRCPLPAEIKQEAEEDRLYKIHEAKLLAELRADDKAQAYARSRGFKL